jgi:hypothetical protein
MPMQAQVHPQPIRLLDAKMEWVISFMSRPLYPWKDPVSVVKEDV